MCHAIDTLVTPRVLPPRLPQVTCRVDNVRIAACDGDRHSPVDALHHLLGRPHILELGALLDEMPDECQGVVAQPAGGLHCECEELRSNLISKTIVAAVLLCLSLPQHTLLVTSTHVKMRRRKRVSNTEVDKNGSRTQTPD